MSRRIGRAERQGMIRRASGDKTGSTGKSRGDDSNTTVTTQT